MFEGLEYPVSTRLAEHNGCIYLDLANERWEAVEIDATGWRIVSNAPVRFRRSRGMLPLPYPAPDGYSSTSRNAGTKAFDGGGTCSIIASVGAIARCGISRQTIRPGRPGRRKAIGTCRS